MVQKKIKFLFNPEWRNDLFYFAEKPIPIATSIRYFFRLFSVLYFVSVQIFFIGAYPTGMPTYLIYLTNQTFTLSLIYFIISFLCTSYICLE